MTRLSRENVDLCAYLEAANILADMQTLTLYTRTPNLHFLSANTHFVSALQTRSLLHSHLHTGEPNTKKSLDAVFPPTLHEVHYTVKHSTPKGKKKNLYLSNTYSILYHPHTKSET